jgi:predicted nucleotidyltransferase
VRIGYFGSYARDDWGVGSDLDLVVVLRESHVPFERRALAFDLGSLPVPADLLVYTVEEWDRMSESGGLPKTIASELVWMHPSSSD